MRARGERNGQSRLTESDVRYIRQQRSEGEKLCVLATIFKVSDMTISNITRRKRWRHVV
jgi:hypothetical protein